MILLSFLGTANYTETNYRWNDRSFETKYSVEACIHFLNPEKVVIFVTQTAREKNLEALQEKLQQYKVSFSVVDVPIGKTEEELWQIFGLLNDQVPDGSEVAMDITTGQRSSPILGVLAAFFMKTGRNVTVLHMLYGAQSVANQQDTKETPLIDLTPMLSLLDWSVAAEHFSRYGNSADLAKILNNYGSGVGKAAMGDLAEYARSRVYRSMGDQLNAVTDALYLLRPYDVMKNISDLESTIDAETQRTQSYSKVIPFSMLRAKIRDTYLPMAEKAPEEPASLIRSLTNERLMMIWYLERDFWIQAISLAKEWLLSWALVWIGEINMLDRSKREQINSLIGALIKLQQNPEKALSDQPDASFMEQIRNQIASHTDFKTFCDLWGEIADLRNDIDHAAKRTDPKSAKSLKGRIAACVNRIRELPLPMMIPGDTDENALDQSGR
ncbi:MAG: hypothetical protein GX421_12280 [Caldisericales bacterium]|nr:hypothetical protein [Caldisericales bacterium]